VQLKKNTKLKDILTYLEDNFSIKVHFSEISKIIIEKALFEYLKRNIFFEINGNTSIQELKSFFLKLGFRSDFYISDVGNLPRNFELQNYSKFIQQKKFKNKIEGKLSIANDLIKDNSYSDFDWYIRFIEKIILNISTKNELEKFKNFLSKIENENIKVFSKTKTLIDSLKEHNPLLKDL